MRNITILLALTFFACNPPPTEVKAIIIFPPLEHNLDILTHLTIENAEGLHVAHSFIIPTEIGKRYIDTIEISSNEITHLYFEVQQGYIVQPNHNKFRGIILINNVPIWDQQINGPTSDYDTQIF